MILQEVIAGIIIGQIGGFFSYLIIATIITLLFCRNRLFTSHTYKEIYTSINAFIFGVPIVIIFKSIVIQYLKIYRNIELYGYPYLIISTLIYFIGFDLMNYIVHRMLHIKFLYKNIHIIHHKFIDPSPFGAIAIHPIEMFLNSVMPSTIMALILPVHIHVWMFSYGFHLCWSIIIHDGLKDNKLHNCVMDARHHGIHHKRPNKNYAFVFSWWDILGNTYYDE